MAKKTVWLPYDMDTAIGINNEGTLAFSYDLEDIDHLSGGADIYNGQDSILWQNVREAYFDEIKTMYKNLRSTGALSYEKVEEMFETHQGKWSEAIFNEDAQFKYIDPLIESGEGSYLSMAQGSKAEQRKWWLWNRFRYLDSKYNAGDALTQVVTVRAYANADVTVTTYASIYASCMYGENNTLIQQRASRNESVTLPRPSGFNLNDTAVYIYSADQLADIGDLSGFKIGYANFASATKLINLKIGDSDPNYSNLNLGAHQHPALTIGNNTLLQKIDVRNCPNLAESIDLSGCTNIEEVYFDGTSITGVQLPNGGVLNTLHLPSTVTNLTIQNQPMLTDLTMPSYSQLTTVVLENAGAVDSYEIVKELGEGARIRIIGFEWNVDSIDEVMSALATGTGIDANGNNTELPQLSGTIHINGTISTADLAYFNNTYTNVTLTYTGTVVPMLYYIRDNEITAARSVRYEVTSWRWLRTVQDGSILYLPNLQYLETYVGRNFYTRVKLGIGKQGDTEIIPLPYTIGMSGTNHPTVYVPDDLVDEYKEATNWSTIADYIYPLSEAPYTQWNGGVF